MLTNEFALAAPLAVNRLDKELLSRHLLKFQIEGLLPLPNCEIYSDLA